jgi:superfamily I DNA/RNA helicase
LTQKQVEIYKEELAEIKPTLKKYETTKEKQAKHIEKLTELEYLYRAYNQYLRDHSRYDFNDMIQFVVQEFR